MEQTLMTPSVRLTRPTDINYIRDLDAKCYAYPLSNDNWKQLINGSGKMGQARVVVIEVDRVPVGFAVWNTEELTRGGRAYDYCYIIRLGVIPKHGSNPDYWNRGSGDIPHGSYKGEPLDYRRQGLGTLLYQAVVSDAKKRGAVGIRTTIPDIHCQPGDPDDSSVFANKVGLKATGEIKKEYMTMYGRAVDGYVFEAKVERDVL